MNDSVELTKSEDSYLASTQENRRKNHEDEDEEEESPKKYNNYDDDNPPPIPMRTDISSQTHEDTSERQPSSHKHKLVNLHHNEEQHTHDEDEYEGEAEFYWEEEEEGSLNSIEMYDDQEEPLTSRILKSASSTSQMLKGHNLQKQPSVTEIHRGMDDESAPQHKSSPHHKSSEEKPPKTPHRDQSPQLLSPSPYNSSTTTTSPRKSPHKSPKHHNNENNNKPKKTSGTSSRKSRLSTSIEEMGKTQRNKNDFIELCENLAHPKSLTAFSSCVPATVFQKLAKILHSICDPLDFSSRLSISSLSNEFEACKGKNHKNLFRGNSLNNKILEEFFRKYSVKFLNYVIAPIIKEVSQYDRILHIDSQIDKKHAEENRDIIDGLVNKLIKNLTVESLEKLPRNVRAILAYIQTKAFNEHKGEEFDILLVVLFLRMINKSLSDTVYWELSKQELSPVVEENLKLISNVISLMPTPKMSQKYPYLQYFEKQSQKNKVFLTSFVKMLVKDPNNLRWADILSLKRDNIGFVPSAEKLYSLKFVFIQYCSGEELSNISKESSHRLEQLKLILDGLMPEQPEPTLNQDELILPDVIKPQLRVAETISELAQQIDGLPAGVWKIDSPGRVLLTCGPVVGKKKNRSTERGFLFLCNDVLLYCKQNPPESDLPFTFSRAFRFSELMISRPEKSGSSSKQIFIIGKYVGKDNDEIIIYTASEKDCRQWFNHIKAEQNSYFNERKVHSERYKVTQITGKNTSSTVLLVLDKEMGSISKMESTTEKLISSYDISKLVSCDHEEDGRLLFNFVQDSEEIIINDHCFYVHSDKNPKIENYIHKMLKFREDILNKKQSPSVHKKSTKRHSTSKRTKPKGLHKTKISKILDEQSHDPYDISTDTSMLSILDQDYTSQTTEFSRSLRKSKKGVPKKRNLKPHVPVKKVRRKFKKNVGNSTFFISPSVEVTEDHDSISDLKTEEVVREYSKVNRVRDSDDIKILKRENRLLRKMLSKRVV
eukprot:TRINITY_DN10422_c0_g1_i1.p1 TRINITY_DN10422_c0_g1~~TRINITY_DN10422_c0_g1_i1.p1  ORF type:complete len:998 (-),score=291.64 TRINITY_DN10422_c0_g1_i1:103-3096(-)